MTVYRFEGDVAAPKGKLTKEDRAEIRGYLSEVRVEAADAEKACRLLAKKLSGRLSKESTGAGAVITLPDYGSACQIKVTAYAEA